MMNKLRSLLGTQAAAASLSRLRVPPVGPAHPEALLRRFSKHYGVSEDVSVWQMLIDLAHSAWLEHATLQKEIAP